MNRIGIYYAFWTHNWAANFVPYVAKVKKLGFDVLEVNSGTVADMTTAERRRLKDTAAKHGIELTACIGLPREYDPASPDRATRERGIAFLKKQARALAETNIHELGGIVYSYWPGCLPAGETDKRPYWDRSIKSMREVMKTAEDCGVTFHMEVVNRFEQYMLNTAAEAVRYIREVGSPNCDVLLDTFHMNIEEDSFAGAIRTAGKHLGHLHIGETNRRAPGRGKMPWDEIFGALKASRFKGSIVMEPFLMPGGEVGRDIKVFRDLRDGVSLDREAARACRFVKRALARKQGVAHA
ncbi:MAG: sugar phosphate isomerase/epimerase [Lentisphaerae bacterium]|nr:sugar phosphate isomerase/epimerase [Lentisphaerota bacterium]